MNNEYNLFLDMDGVLVDFVKGYTDLARTIDWNEMEHNTWEVMVRQKYAVVSMDPEWWANLPWIGGGKELWKESMRLFKDVCILSSASSSVSPRFSAIDEGKRRWIKKNTPQIKDSNVFIVEGKAWKKNYASKNAILVDDVEATIKDWNSAGGFGILHDSSKYKDTIETLVDIASPTNLSEIVKRLYK